MIKMLETEKIDKIRNIYLFGSVARGDIKNSSDVDIFVECYKDGEAALKKDIGYIREKFFFSKTFEIWKAIGVENPINIVIGSFDEWGLRDSVTKDGILLFGKSVQANLNKYAIIEWSTPKDAKTRVKLNRKIFGYWGKNKRYKGVIEEAGERIGNSAVIIGQPYMEKITNILKELGVNYRVIEVFK
ncbi:MAG: hypothetical protein DRP03_02860 [Candidatus Aenigmatarchaeota archaeon]|nr:MAG: hypothetical protein DRP03_02860 [Candidatus Aenigmarchaeota archaeon]